MITGVRRGGDVAGYEFRCGCGYSSVFADLYYDDPYVAALTSRDFHLCGAKGS